MNAALLSSKNMCWCTPQDFFDKLNAEFGFVLDPAATDKTAKCSLYYTPETDGLSQSWDRGGGCTRLFRRKGGGARMNAALLSSKNMCWCTPQDFFDKLNAEFGFVLDPAATDKTAKCSLYYTPETDGLSQSWDRGGAVFCNPPYGREIGKWVQKAFEEARGWYPIVLLIPARTDTAYFHDYIYGKAEIRFVRGRLRFTDDDGNAADPAPFPSMVVIYNGERVKE